MAQGSDLAPTPHKLPQMLAAAPSMGSASGRSDAAQTLTAASQASLEADPRMPSSHALEESWTCSAECLDRICSKADSAPRSWGRSCSPRPTSTWRTRWARSGLADRIATCELAAAAHASSHGGDAWIHAWRSGETNGFAVPRQIAAFLGAATSERLGRESIVEAHLVCGADLVLRRGGWQRPSRTPAIVLARPGIELPRTRPGKGWQVAQGNTRPASSTQIREAIGGGRWEQLVELGCEASVVEFMRGRQESNRLFMEKA
uniref:Uncharacterized protein n=1 Tax=Alexandrium catenella TaxID=2925 RepID=A0A7S1QQU6_ALECA